MPSSDSLGDLGDDPIDALAPLRAAAGAPDDTWRERLQVTLDQIRSGGPTRWLAVVLAVVVLGTGGGVVLVARSSATARSGSAGSSVSLPFAHAAGTGSGVGSGVGPKAGGADTAGAVGPGGTASPELIVQAAGAVVRPGVYHLATGARVADLVVAAGGLAPDADGDRVNLASPLADGARVYLPRQGEVIPPGPVSDGGGSGASSGPSTTAPPIDLNIATAEQLDTLPGVGPATAAAIIDYRQRHGPFRSVGDLAQVRGIGDAKLAQLRDLVRVG